MTTPREFRSLLSEQQSISLYSGDDIVAIVLQYEGNTEKNTEAIEEAERLLKSVRRVSSATEKDIKVINPADFNVDPNERYFRIDTVMYILGKLYENRFLEILPEEHEIEARFGVMSSPSLESKVIVSSRLISW